MTDLDKVVGAVDVSDSPTGITFNLLNPNNPVFLLDLPGLDDEPFFIRGKEYKTFVDILKKLDLRFEVEIRTGDPDNPMETVELTFEKMSDFQMSEIIKNVQVLKNLQTIQNALTKLVDPERLENNTQLLALFEEGNEQLKDDFIHYLDYWIELL